MAFAVSAAIIAAADAHTKSAGWLRGQLAAAINDTAGAANVHSSLITSIALNLDEFQFLIMMSLARSSEKPRKKKRGRKRERERQR